MCFIKKAIVLADFAEAYFQKIKRHLDKEKCDQFLQELIDFQVKTTFCILLICLCKNINEEA